MEGGRVWGGGPCTFIKRGKGTRGEQKLSGGTRDEGYNRQLTKGVNGQY